MFDAQGNLVDDTAMSGTTSYPALYESYECPVVDSHRLILHLAPRTTDVGDVPVNRLMPQCGRWLIGAWCFLGHAGLGGFSIGSNGLRVGPHPPMDSPC
jgi:hypothetical protein